MRLGTMTKLGGVKCLSPGMHFEVCDAEGEMALLKADQNWYRAHMDDLLNSSVPISGTCKHMEQVHRRRKHIPITTEAVKF